MITPEARAELRALAEAATPGPWSSDDGNIFSKPERARRTEIFRRRMLGEAHPDRGRVYPLGFVATTTQESDNFEANEAFIAACRTEVPALLDALDAAEDALRYQHDAAYGDNGATWREALRRVTAVLGEDLLSADRVYPDRTAVEAENARLSALVKDLRAALAVLP